MNFRRSLPFVLSCLGLACGGSVDEPFIEGAGGASGATNTGGVAAGFGTGGTSTGGTAGAGTGGYGAVGPGGAGGTGGIVGDWQTLVEGTWDLPGGSEEYRCVKKTVDQDIYVKSFGAINPVGTHHTVLTVGPPQGPDGIERCSAFDNSIQQIYGSGVGTNEITFPEGIAVKIEAGTQLFLNLHLFNTRPDGITGTSGTRIIPVDESEVEHVAEVVLAGTLSLNIPPQQESTAVGNCRMSDDYTLFSVLPHMHQMGRHQKVIAESSIEGDVVLIDEPYDFDEQLIYDIDPVQVAAGDRVRVECTYENPTSQTVRWGDSSNQEMCFSGIFRYPATGGFFICADGVPF